MSEETKEDGTFVNLLTEVTEGLGELAINDNRQPEEEVKMEEASKKSKKKRKKKKKKKKKKEEVLQEIQIIT